MSPYVQWVSVQGRDHCLGGGLSVQGISVLGVSVQGRDLYPRVSVWRGVSVNGGLCQGGSLSGRPPMLLYGYVRAVRILLECILVFYMYC